METLAFDAHLRACKRGPDDCWLWPGPLDGRGYGLGSVPGFQTHRAHRITYEQEFGPIPSHLEIDHMCHNRSCVNPRHLQAVTSKENQENRDGAYSNSKSGIRGVHWHKTNKKWQATIRHHGQKIHIGYFESAELAEQAAIAKRNELFTNSLMDRRAA